MRLGIDNENARHGDAKKSFTTGVAVGRQLKGWVTGGGGGGSSDCFWRVRYYNHLGTTLLYTEYVANGDNALWGAGRVWSLSAGGQPVAHILNNVSTNIDVYSYTAYVELLYIATTGTQWINTGYHPTTDTHIIIDIDLVNYTAPSASFLLGCDWSARPWAFNWDRSTGFILWSNGRSGTGRPATFEERITIDIYRTSASWSKYDGTPVGNLRVSTTPTAVNSDLYLFTLSGWGASCAIKCKFYGCQIYNGDTLVRDFRPVLDENNVACLYDMVFSTYYYNAGSGTFVVPT